MQEALKITNLTKKRDKFTLSNISFSIPEGSIMGFIGPNGSGKTTTIKSILNLIPDTSGEIKIFGKDFEEVREEVAMVTDFSFYDEDWKVSEVEKIVKMFYKNWDEQKFNTLLHQFGIDKGKKISELSRGMNVKMMLAVAFSQGARLLVLDEPTSGLDPLAREEICAILKDYVKNSGGSILFSTHISSDLEKVADYITFVLNGELVFSDSKDVVLAKYRSTDVQTLEDIMLSLCKELS